MPIKDSQETIGKMLIRIANVFSACLVSLRFSSILGFWELDLRLVIVPTYPGFVSSRE